MLIDISKYIIRLIILSRIRINASYSSNGPRINSTSCSLPRSWTRLFTLLLGLQKVEGHCDVGRESDKQLYVLGTSCCSRGIGTTIRVFYIFITSPKRTRLYYNILTASLLFCPVMFSRKWLRVRQVWVRPTEWFITHCRIPFVLFFISLFLGPGTLAFRFLLVLTNLRLFGVSQSVTTRAYNPTTYILYGQCDMVHQVTCTSHPVTVGCHVVNLGGGNVTVLYNGKIRTSDNC